VPGKKARTIPLSLTARQPSARHNPFAPQRVAASGRAGDTDSSGRQGGERGRRKKKARKPREAGATTATPLPPPLPRRLVRVVESPWTPAPRPSPARRRGAPGRSAPPPRPPPQVRFWLPSRRLRRCRVSSPGRSENGSATGPPPGTRRCRWLLDLGRAARPRPRPRGCRRRGPRRSSRPALLFSGFCGCFEF
jgi:hypothetical protein